MLYIICEDIDLANNFKEYVEDKFTGIKKIKILMKDEMIKNNPENEDEDVYSIIINKKGEKTYQFSLRNSYEINELDSLFSDVISLGKDPKIEILLHSMCANYIINKISNYKSNNNLKDLEINYQLNSITNFDNKLDDNGKLIVYTYLIPIFFIFLYGTIFLNFLSRLIDEKEKKLDILLSRHGVVELPYFLSWYLTFLVLIAYPLIIVTICAKLLLYPHINSFFFFINQFIFITAFFSFCYFLQNILSTLKQTQSLYKLLFFGITIFSFVIILPSTSIYTKYIFSIFPHSVLIENLQTLILFEFNKSVDSELFYLTVNGISFFDTYLFYLFEIIFFIGFNFLNKKYKNSGYSFFQFILNCCKKKIE